MVRRLLILSCLLLTGTGSLQAPAALGDNSPEPATALAQSTPSEGGGPSRKLTNAEQVARLQGSLESDIKRLADLEAELQDPQSEYEDAQADFRELDEPYEQKLRQWQELEDQGKTNDEPAMALKAEIEALKKPRELAKERFDLAIASRKAIHEKIATLKEKITQQQEALKRLLGEQSPAPAKAEAAEAPSKGEPEPAKPGPESSPAPIHPLLPGMPSLPAPDPGAEPAVSKPRSKELLRALKEVKSLAENAEQAEAQAEELTARIEVIDRQIRLEREMLDNARRKIDNAEETRFSIEQEIQAQSLANANLEQVQPLFGRLTETEQRLRQARIESREHTDRISRLQAERSDLITEQNAAMFQARFAREQFERAQVNIQRLKNPFSLENLLQWAADHIGNLLAIVIGMFLLRMASRVFSRRIVRLMSHRSVRGTTEEREDRIRTLVGVFQNAASIAIVVGGFLMLCQELGIPIGPLMGGAAVLGLAVAFGAQNLIRDYFYGFVILLENQYKLNDVVRIQGIGGQVEAISLRMTVLRDLEGCVHFIPNGEITKVTNMTHGWSRALFDLGIAYKEDMDRVMQIIIDLGKEMRKDPTFGPLILEDLTMLGVDAFSDSAVMVKFFIKTRPLQQWTVKREMNRRIKKRFDELGIVIPFPHRTVYHIHDHEMVEEAPSYSPHVMLKPVPKGLNVTSG
ncbi:hypothetical protein BH23PLA1_BH23PLA1_32790 [soil metagenome]